MTKIIFVDIHNGDGDVVKSIVDACGQGRGGSNFAETVWTS